MIGFDALRPAWFALVPVGLVLFGIGFWALHARRAKLARFVVPERLARFAPHVSIGRPLVRLAFASAGIVLLVVGAAGPVRGYTLRESHSQGLDIVVCLDTSRSMLARDLRPDRLSRAKRELIGLFDRLAGDRCAILAFSGDAREVAPLTDDYETLGALLEYVTTDDNRRGGTNLATAIERALDMFDGRTGAHEVVVVLTDGEDLEGRAAAVAETAAERGIRVFVVGVGTEAGGKIPVVDGRGREGFLTNPEGEEVVTRLDGDTLASLAEVTGGAYLSTEQSPTPLEDLYGARIAKIEGMKLEGGKKRIPHDRYQWALVLGLACMLAEVGLRERRVRPRRQGYGGGIA